MSRGMGTSQANGLLRENFPQARLLEQGYRQGAEKPALPGSCLVWCGRGQVFYTLCNPSSSGSVELGGWSVDH